ncbi:MAG TPA: DUF1223 domain-containing protein [Pyrinomonadaceae bacterium]|jgi:hypothetical protein
MKSTFIASCLLAASIFAACSFQTVESQKIDEKQTPKSENQIKKSPVLVELFTSEGCSSCPPADDALAFLEKEQPFMQAEIITLALHVDYWNHLGWKDEFSSPLYSQRQGVYAQKLKLDSTYTPQMIVDGQIQFVGSNTGEASKAILEAAKSPKANIETVLSGNALKIKISDVPKHSDASVFLAIAENNLASSVKRGENSGKNLAHTSVVRDLRPIGKIEAKSGAFEQQTTVERNPQWNQANLSYVVFVQENESRKIIGTARVQAGE